MTVVSSGTQDLMDGTHAHIVLSKLNEQRSQGLFCDVTIVVEDVKFRAHRNILVACSGYFRNALTASEAWSSGQVLELMDLKSDVFASILNFIYCSKVTSIGTEDTGGLMAAGKRLGIPFLEGLAEQERWGSDISKTVPGNAKTTDSSKVFILKKTKNEAQTSEEIEITEGPRITNAFSITEVGPGNNPFTPLILTNGDRQSPNAGQAPGSCPAPSGLTGNNEPTHALSEHSYAVSQAVEQKDSCSGDNNKVSKLPQIQSKPLSHSCNIGPLKKRHRLQGALARGIPQTQTVVPHTDVATTNSPKLADPVMTTPTLVMTPPSLYSEAEKGRDTAPPMAHADAHIELDPPHLSPHTADGISIYGCEYCPEIFTNKALLAIHTEVHKKRFVSHLYCKFCHRKFMHLKRLRNHEQVCPKASRDSSELDPTDQETSAVDQHSDNEQSMESQASQLAPAELSISFNSDPIQMDQTVLQQTVEKVVKPGGGQRVYNCSVCKRVYVTLSSLKRHENVHSWQRAYPCHYCNKVFALAEYRTKHEIWHTGERRYQCIFCLETFMTYYILKNHQKTFHGIDPRLAVKKKAANGGFKASVYPIKLYRLLPMKFRKRRYKTYSHTYSDGVEDDQDGQAPQECNSLISSFEDKGVISSPDAAAFPMPVTFMATTKTVASVMPRISFDQPCDQDIDQSLSTAGEKCHQKITRKDTERRGSPLISDVESPALDYGDNIQALTNSDHTSHELPLLAQSLSTVNRLGELSEAAKRVEAMSKEMLLSGSESLTPDKMVGAKTETYIAKPACSGPSVHNSTLPLCQITVKIGNEAIIRRRIKGSKLFPRKRKRSRHLGQAESPGQCHPTRCSIESPSLRLQTEVTPETYEDPNDHDTGDNLWRPYYSYKPKKKSKKLRFKHRKEKQYSFAASRTAASDAYLGRRCRDTDEGISAGNREMKHGPRNCSPRANYTCDICDSSFITESGLKAHIIGSHPCFCRTCGKQGPPGEAPASGDYICNSCMENGSCFDVTPRSPSTEKKYHCSYCPQRFLYLATKRSHEKKHQETSGKGYKYDSYTPRSKRSTNPDEDDIQHGIKTEECDYQDSGNVKSSELRRGHLSIDKLKPKTEDTDDYMPLAPKPFQEISYSTIKSTSSCTDTIISLTSPKMKHKMAKKRINMQHPPHLTSKKQAHDRDNYKGLLVRPINHEKPSHIFCKNDAETKPTPMSMNKPEKWLCKQEPFFDGQN